MNKYVIKQITQKEASELNGLIEIINTTLQDKNWFLPIKQIAMDNFFNNEWTCFLGCYDEGKLIGASALFFNKYEWEYSAKQINLGDNVAEIGRSMVLPEYRNQNIMFKLNSELLKIAKEKNIKHLIATVHPKNIASKKSLEKLGFTNKKTIMKDGYLRDVMSLTM